jgi:drug/metabolite transporter (DMT)-like permease
MASTEFSRRHSHDVLGASAALAACVAVATNDALLKTVMSRLSVPQVLAFRGAMVTSFLTMVVVCRRECQRPSQTLLLRSLLDGAGSVCFLTALRSMPQANCTAIVQVLPLAVVAAMAARGEHVTRTAWACVGMGLIGVLIIIRPGLTGFDQTSLLPAAAVGIMTARDVLTRTLPQSVPSLLVAVWAAVGNMSAGLVLLPSAGWHAIEIHDAMLVALAGVCICTFYMGTILLMRFGSVAVTQPVRYTLLLWAALAGYVSAGDVPDSWTAVGGTLIVAGGLFSLWAHAGSLEKARGVGSRAGGLAAEDSAAHVEMRNWDPEEGQDGPPAAGPSNRVPREGDTDNTRQSDDARDASRQEGA